MKEKTLTIKTDLIGTLNIEYILLEDKFPRIFVAVNENEERFLMCENESTKKRYSWLLAKISNQDIVALDDGRKKVADIFSENENKKYVLLDKENKQGRVTNYCDRENLSFVNKETKLGFLNEGEREEAGVKEQKLDFEKMQFVQKKEKENINPEEFDVTSKKKEKIIAFENEENYEDFENFERKEVKKTKAKLIESKDEIQEDLDNYEEFAGLLPEIEESETQKNYFDDWDYKNPEKMALEQQKKEERKKKRKERKKARAKAIDNFLGKIGNVLHDKRFWAKVVLCLVILAMFISVFVAVFINKGSGGEQVIEIPGSEEMEETKKTISNLMLRILK